MSSPHVAVIGGGLAGLAASVALADHDFRVSLFEKQPRLGGRATSYVLPDGEQIDNCQHVTLRCCTNLENFYRRIGVAAKIQYYESLLFVDSKGRRAVIKPSKMPAPLHLAASFTKSALLDWRDKLSIARAMLCIVRNAGKYCEGRRPLTMLDWLKRHNQTRRAIDQFWRVVLISALNEELDRTDASYGLSVFWKAFLSNAQGFGIGIPSIPLSELYAAIGDRLGESGGEIRTRSAVAQLTASNNEITSIRLDNEAEIHADYYVVATSFDRFVKILPESLRHIPSFENIHNLRGSPITSIHFWFDRPVMADPFLTTLDLTIQWIFNKSKLSGKPTEGRGQYLQIVISASHGLKNRSQQEIIDSCKADLALILPTSREAKVLRSLVIRENAATFSPEPGCDAWRPSQRTPIRNLFLAGDWTHTGWPATMEGAVRSGYLAAEAILGLAGKPSHLVQPDLPTTGLARWLMRTTANSPP